MTYEPALAPSERHNAETTLLAAVALAGGIVQILATVLLNAMPLYVRDAAVADGPGAYLLALLGISVSIAAVWVLRQRSRAAAGLGLVGVCTVISLSASRLSPVGLAYYTEYVLHHFNALVALLLIGRVAQRWFRTGQLPFRAAALSLGAGGIALVVAHFATLPSMTSLAHPAVQGTGLCLALAGFGLGLATSWPTLAQRSVRWLAPILVAVLLLRIGLAGLPGLTGAPVPNAKIGILVGATALTGLAATLLMRPRLEIWARTLALAISGTVVLVIEANYQANFGRFEARQSVLLRSLFGYQIPYPETLESWQIWTGLLSLFFLIAATYTALMSRSDRQRGVAMGVLLTAGMGLGSPHLVLMSVAGLLTFSESLFPREELADDAVSDHGSISADSSGQALDEALNGLAELLHLPAPIRVAELTAVRGHFENTAIDLTLRPTRRGARLELRVGVPGRERPVLQLKPDTGRQGSRPDHLIARTHRWHGDLRVAEGIPDEFLDAFSPFTRAHFELWAAGATVDFGPDLSSVEARRLEALTRALTRQLAA